MGEEQLDYDDDEYGGSHKAQYQSSGAIPALAEEEMMGEDDEYDDLYNDVNVGEGFLQLQRSEPQRPTGFANGGIQTQNTDAPKSRVEPGAHQELNIPKVANEGNYSNAGNRFAPVQDQGMAAALKGPEGTVNYAEKARPSEMTHDLHVGNVGLRGSAPMPNKIGAESTDISAKVANEPAPLMNPNTTGAGPRGVPQMPNTQVGTNVNFNRPMGENTIRTPVENGATMLFVGELHWWTTDAELESVLSQYGRVKEIKFFDERASGKSKGYCQVEFFDSAAAAACKEGMHGHVFNGRACVVAFASPQTLKQMGASYMNKNQVGPPSQSQGGGRGMNDRVGGRGGGMNYGGGDAGRNFGRAGGWGRGGAQGILNRGPGGGPGGGPMRGRGPMGAGRGGAGVGPGGNGGGYGQGLGGPAFGGPAVGLMNPQGMMGAGFDPTYMGRGGYGGFSAPGFPGMVPSFPAVNTMGLAGVAPHVNPAFFGRGMAANGMGMMGPTGMEGHAGMWSDAGIGGWAGGVGGGEEQQGRRTRESSYGGDDGGSEYGYGGDGGGTQEKGIRSSAASSREKDRSHERDWSERRHRDESDYDRPEREQRYREEKDTYRDHHRQRERDLGYDDDWDNRGQPSSRSRSRSRAVPEDDYRSRSRDADYGKRRRMPSE